MSKLLFCLATVATALTLILFHLTPALPQSNPKQPDLTINTATRLDVIKATIKTFPGTIRENRHLHWRPTGKEQGFNLM